MQRIHSIGGGRGSTVPLTTRCPGYSFAYCDDSFILKVEEHIGLSSLQALYSLSPETDLTAQYLMEMPDLNEEVSLAVSLSGSATRLLSEEEQMRFQLTHAGALAEEQDLFTELQAGFQTTLEGSLAAVNEGQARRALTEEQSAALFGVIAHAITIGEEQQLRGVFQAIWNLSEEQTVAVTNSSVISDQTVIAELTEEQQLALTLLGAWGLTEEQALALGQAVRAYGATEEEAVTNLAFEIQMRLTEEQTLNSVLSTPFGVSEEQNIAVTQSASVSTQIAEEAQMSFQPSGVFSERVEQSVAAVNSASQSQALAEEQSLSFPPVWLTGLQAWYDADRESYSDSGAITTLHNWAGRAARNLSCATAAERPTLKHGVINGRKVVDFTTHTSAHLRCAAFLGTTIAGSIFVVLARRSTGAGRIIEQCDTGVNQSRWTIGWRAAAEDLTWVAIPSTAAPLTNHQWVGTTNLVQTTGSAAIAEWHWNGTSHFFVLNGTTSGETLAVGTGTGGQWFGQTSGTDEFVMGGLRVGAALQNPIGAQVGEVLIYDGTLQDSTAVRAYLASKWGITIA